MTEMVKPAAFRRLCVETFSPMSLAMVRIDQPPSGGCVLKPKPSNRQQRGGGPAAFRRLCVETLQSHQSRLNLFPSRLQAAVC